LPLYLPLWQNLSIPATIFSASKEKKSLIFTSNFSLRFQQGFLHYFASQFSLNFAFVSLQIFAVSLRFETSKKSLYQFQFSYTMQLIRDNRFDPITCVGTNNLSIIGCAPTP
jgi:hypothetical protein